MPSPATTGISCDEVPGRYGRRRRPEKPMISEIMKITRKTKKRTLAIAQLVPAIRPKPKSPATRAMIRKTRDQ